MNNLIETPAQRLITAFARLEKTVPKVTSIPELQSIKFDIRSGWVQLSATNLRIYQVQNIEADTNPNFQGLEFLIPAKTFKALKVFKPEDLLQIYFDTDQRRGYFSQGKTKVTFMSREIDDFHQAPEFAPSDPYYFSKPKTLLQDLDFAAHCADTKTNSFQGFNGLVFSPTPDNLEAASTDGNRLAVSVLQGEYKGKTKRHYAIDSDSLAVLRHYIKTANTRGLSLDFSDSQKLIKAFDSDSKLYMLQSEVDFVDYQEYVPDSFYGQAMTFRVNRKELHTTLKNLAKAAEVERAFFTLTKELDIIFPDHDTNISTVFPVEDSVYPDSKNCIALNSKYVLDCLKFATTEDIDAAFEGEGMPTYWRSGNHTCVIMSLSLH